MNVADLTLALRVLAATPPSEATVAPLADSPFQVWDVLYVPEGMRWKAPPTDLEECSVLVLEGKATWLVDDDRQTRGSGHLLTAPPGSALAVDNDGSGPVVALVTRIHGPSPALVRADEDGRRGGMRSSRARESGSPLDVPAFLPGGESPR